MYSFVTCMKKLLVIIIATGILSYLWYARALSPIDPAAATRSKVTIDAGSTTSKIATQLKEEGLIRSPFAFKLHLKLKGLDGSLQAGVFLLDESQSVMDLVTILQTGRAEEMIVTIPEGFTVQDIDQVLVEMELIEKGDAVRCANECDFESYTFLPSDTANLAKRGGKLEGYLFPDTYYVPAEDFVVKFFFERMLNAFRDNVVTEYGDEITDLHEFITMTSLVEEETRTDEERPVVAGIIWKRYEAGWGLGIDAAVRYIVNKPTEAITHADLNVNSPYNLRKFKGLPPGPISSVSLKSIIATLRPKKSAYWYYLHDKTGKIHYSETNEEHNTNRYFFLGGGSKMTE
ncbi:hypothetical protein CL635_00285 [bacterium]|nr:hypothetical protein [bacterium]